MKRVVVGVLVVMSFIAFTATADTSEKRIGTDDRELLAELEAAIFAGSEGSASLRCGNAPASEEASAGSVLSMSWVCEQACSAIYDNCISGCGSSLGCAGMCANRYSMCLEIFCRQEV